jgi:uncharacterized alkaline shock family protein YloU
VEPVEKAAPSNKPVSVKTHTKEEPRGKTVIADEVVSVIARIAAEQVEGVHQLGDSNLRGVFSRLGRHGGIESEVGQKEAAIDVDVVVEYGVPITKVANTLRKQIIDTVEYMTGRNVVEVNINVVDVYIPRAQTETKQKRSLE